MQPTNKLVWLTF